MKTLYLMRHAKSDWSSPAASDHDRPLNRQGQKAAPRMGHYMATHKYLPDLVLCSSATRTQQTWQCLAAQLTGTPLFETASTLYHASSATILKRVQNLPEEHSAILLIGHNPGMHEAANYFADIDETGTDAPSLTSAFPTAALAVLTFNTNAWADVNFGQGILVDFMTPKRLPKSS